jgi:glycosyltransferase involved in cell wall biosynthesis
MEKTHIEGHRLIDEKHKTFTIITPSYNQAAYIEQTIRSVQEQNYPKVQHIVVDGGSTDGTVAILKRHAKLIWVSEKDFGQADALNKGLAMATGDIIGWINSDDYYETDVFSFVAKCFNDPNVSWVIGNLCCLIEDTGQIINYKSPRVSYDQLLKNPDIVRQPSTFFRRSLLQRAGGWRPEFFMTMDFDLWVRLAKLGAPTMVDRNLAYFRLHSAQKTSLVNAQKQIKEICKVLIEESAPLPIIARVYLKKQCSALRGYLKSHLFG